MSSAFGCLGCLFISVSGNQGGSGKGKKMREGHCVQLDIILANLRHELRLNICIESGSAGANFFHRSSYAADLG